MTETQNGQTPQGIGAIERLEMRARTLLVSNRDPRLARYLQEFLGRIARQKYQVNLLEQELDQQLRNYGVWQVPPPQNANAQASVPPMHQQVQPQPQGVLSQNMPMQQYNPVPQPQQAVRRRRSAEFVIGTALSIVGGVFVLIALLLLGMYFMNGFVKGMLLYAGCLAVMLVSELVLYRRWRGMGETFSAIAIGGLYITTLVNDFSLGNFDEWVCLAVTAVITVATVFLSRKRNAASYRIIGIAACYLSMLLMPVVESGTAWLLTLTGVLLLMNLMCVFVPVRTHAEAISIAHLALHTLGSVVVFFKWADGGNFTYTGNAWSVMIWIAAALVTEQLIFVCDIRGKYARRKADGTPAFHVGMCIAYTIAMPFCALIAFLGAACWADGNTSILVTEKLLCTIAITVLCGGALCGLRGRRERWFPYYLFCVLMLAVHIEDVSVHPYTYAICLTLVWILTELLTFTKDILAVVGCAVLTGYACLFLLWTRGETRSFFLLAGLLAGILCINRFRTYFSAILTFTLALYASYYMLPSLRLPVFVGLLFLGMLLFNNVERWKDRGILVYNLLALTGQGICYLMLLNPVYRNAYLTYFCMLIFGISTIVLCFQPKYHLDARGREMTVAGFLTYMALILKTDYGIINSILLMAIALVSVTVGFASHKKSVRIYGLILSLLVCAKIVVLDFLEAELLQKTILFFAVGLLAITISVIYMVLEKRMQRTAERERVRNEG